MDPVIGRVNPRNEYQRKWRELNRKSQAKHPETKRKYYAANFEKSSEVERNKRAADPEKSREAVRKSKAKYPETQRAINQQRRASIKTSVVNAPTAKQLVLPLSRGGTHDLDNLVPSCKACNLSKGCKSPTEWSGRRLEHNYEETQEGSK